MPGGPHTSPPFCGGTILHPPEAGQPEASCSLDKDLSRQAAQSPTWKPSPTALRRPNGPPTLKRGGQAWAIEGPNCLGGRTRAAGRETGPFGVPLFWGACSTKLAEETARPFGHGDNQDTDDITPAGWWLRRCL